MASWIKGAIKHPGALHRQMGISMKKKIPMGMMADEAKRKGKAGMRARLAMTLSKMKTGRYG